MNHRLSLGISLLLGASGPVLWPGALAAADAPTTSHALNVARANLGARLTVELPAGASVEGAPRIVQALLSEDDPLGCELPAGTTSLIVALPRTETLHHLDFLNLTAAGQVSVAASNVRLPADNPRWRALGGAQDFTQPNDVVACELGTTEARYVRVTFNLPKAGRIDTLGLFGDTTAASLGRARARQVGGRAFVGYEQLDSGNASAQARVTKISSGGGTGEADKMLDGNLRTSYTFAPTDRHPTTVVDLGTNRTLTRTSVAFRAGPGRMDFYLTPDPNAHTSIVRRNPSYSGQTTQVPEVSSSETSVNQNPIATVQSDGRPGLQRVTVGMSGETGRYLAVIFTPSGGGGSRPPERRATGDYKDFKDQGSDYKDYKDAPTSAAAEDGFLSDSPLSVSELAAFGPAPSSIATIPQLPSAGQNFSPGPSAGPTAGPTAVITP